MPFVRSFWRVIIRGALLSLIAAELGAQATTARLQPPTVSAEHLFVGIAAVRELSDGRVLVSDGGDDQLFLVRFGESEPVRIGRKGAGPGEYGSAGVLWRIRGDSTLFPDPVNGRWHVLAGGQLAISWAPDDPFVRRVGSGGPSSIDTTGRALVLQRMRLRSASAESGADSLFVLRVSRSSARTDTLARIRGRPTTVPPAGSAAARNPMFARAFGLPLTGPEQALLMPDGWIAVARDNPYRVDWISPDGRVRAGAPIAEPQARVDDAERAAYARRVSQRTGRPTRLGPEARWPEYVAPFEEDALLAAPDGSVLIRRQPTARAPAPRYDVIARDGRRIRQLQLADGARIVGSGPRGIYVATLDAEGMQRLTRHPWP
jgi:hypothetical protein